MSSNTTILYRPVGPEELDLIRKSGFKRFPPRVRAQPIFYPVVQEEYARKIAREWNNNGCITRFQINTDYLSKYNIQNVGGKNHSEYWIPANELETFNDNIVGLIEVLK